jgi:hypothetical protein
MSRANFITNGVQLGSIKPSFFFSFVIFVYFVVKISSDQGKPFETISVESTPPCGGRDSRARAQLAGNQTRPRKTGRA